MTILLSVLFVLAGIGLDRVVKLWAEMTLKPIGSIPVWDGVFRLTYAENTGAAFSFFRGQRWFLVAVTGVVLAALIFALLTKRLPAGLARWGGLCVVSGEIGNLIDRVTRGYVIDMFDFYLINFAIFNVADVLVCVGGGLFALWVIIGMVKEKKHDGTRKS